MSLFTDAVFERTGEIREGRPLYRITNGLVYDIGFLDSGLCIRVPAGYVTDGPSIPRWLSRLIPKMPIHQMIRSAAVHDFLREDLRFNKAEGDAIFLMAMYTEKTPAWLRELAYFAVRMNNSRKRAK